MCKMQPVGLSQHELERFAQKLLPSAAFPGRRHVIVSGLPPSPRRRTSIIKHTLASDSKLQVHVSHNDLNDDASIKGEMSASLPPNSPAVVQASYPSLPTTGTGTEFADATAASDRQLSVLNHEINGSSDKLASIFDAELLKGQTREQRVFNGVARRPEPPGMVGRRPVSTLTRGHGDRELRRTPGERWPADGPAPAQSITREAEPVLSPAKSEALHKRAPHAVFHPAAAAVFWPADGESKGTNHGIDAQSAPPALGFETIARLDSHAPTIALPGAQHASQASQSQITDHDAHDADARSFVADEQQVASSPATEVREHHHGEKVLQPEGQHHHRTRTISCASSNILPVTVTVIPEGSVTETEDSFIADGQSSSDAHPHHAGNQGADSLDQAAIVLKHSGSKQKQKLPKHRFEMETISVMFAKEATAIQKQRYHDSKVAEIHAASSPDTRGQRNAHSNGGLTAHDTIDGEAARNNGGDHHSAGYDAIPDSGTNQAVGSAHQHPATDAAMPGASQAAVAQHQQSHPQSAPAPAAFPISAGLGATLPADPPAVPAPPALASGPAGSPQQSTTFRVRLLPRATRDSADAGASTATRGASSHYAAASLSPPSSAPSSLLIPANVNQRLLQQQLQLQAAQAEVQKRMVALQQMEESLAAKMHQHEQQKQQQQVQSSTQNSDGHPLLPTSADVNISGGDVVSGLHIHAPQGWTPMAGKGQGQDTARSSSSSSSASSSSSSAAHADLALVGARASRPAAVPQGSPLPSKRSESRIHLPHSALSPSYGSGHAKLPLYDPSSRNAAGVGAEASVAAMQHGVAVDGQYQVMLVPMQQLQQNADSTGSAVRGVDGATSAPPSPPAKSDRPAHRLPHSALSPSYGPGHAKLPLHNADGERGGSAGAANGSRGFAVALVPMQSLGADADGSLATAQLSSASSARLPAGSPVPARAGSSKRSPHSTVPDQQSSQAQQLAHHHHAHQMPHSALSPSYGPDHAHMPLHLPSNSDSTRQAINFSVAMVAMPAEVQDAQSDNVTTAQHGAAGAAADIPPSGPQLPQGLSVASPGQVQKRAGRMPHSALSPCYGPYHSRMPLHQASSAAVGGDAGQGTRSESAPRATLAQPNFSVAMVPMVSGAADNATLNTIDGAMLAAAGNQFASTAAHRLPQGSPSMAPRHHHHLPHSALSPSYGPDHARIPLHQAAAADGSARPSGSQRAAAGNSSGISQPGFAVAMVPMVEGAAGNSTLSDAAATSSSHAAGIEGITGASHGQLHHHRMPHSALSPSYGPNHAQMPLHQESGSGTTSTHSDRRGTAGLQQPDFTVAMVPMVEGAAGNATASGGNTSVKSITPPAGAVSEISAPAARLPQGSPSMLPRHQHHMPHSALSPSYGPDHARLPLHRPHAGSASNEEPQSTGAAGKDAGMQVTMVNYSDPQAAAASAAALASQQQHQQQRSIRRMQRLDQISSALEAVRIGVVSQDLANQLQLSDTATAPANATTSSAATAPDGSGSYVTPPTASALAPPNIRSVVTRSDSFYTFGLPESQPSAMPLSPCAAARDTAVDGGISPYRKVSNSSPERPASGLATPTFSAINSGSIVLGTGSNSVTNSAKLTATAPLLPPSTSSLTSRSDASDSSALMGPVPQPPLPTSAAKASSAAPPAPVLSPTSATKPKAAPAAAVPIADVVVAQLEHELRGGLLSLLGDEQQMEEFIQQAREKKRRERMGAAAL